MNFDDLISELPYLPLVDTSARDKASLVELQVIDLFEQFRNPLLRYALSFGIPVHDAEEVIQEVFLSLFRHLQLQRSRSNLRGWIFRVTHNLALKRRAANQQLNNRMEPDGTTLDMHPDASLDPEQQFSLLQRQNRLIEVIDSLPEVDRQCLLLRAEGLRYREIAAVLEIALGTVSNSLARSVDRLVRAEGR
jgi:RNA polymerase sigma-70 factor (ECF subfamily)